MYHLLARFTAVDFFATRHRYFGCLSWFLILVRMERYTRIVSFRDHSEIRVLSEDLVPLSKLYRNPWQFLKKPLLILLHLLANQGEISLLRDRGSHVVVLTQLTNEEIHPVRRY